MIGILSFLNGTKNLWLIGGIVAASIGLWAVDANRKQAAFEKGFEAGKGAVSVAAVKSATETAAAEREALEATPIPKDKQEIIERCRRAASCRERHKL